MTRPRTILTLALFALASPGGLYAQQQPGWEIESPTEEGGVVYDFQTSPAIKVRANYIKIIPGEKIEARHATLYLGDVPVFYFPFYSRSLGVRANHFNFVPGYRSSFGPFLLGSYVWFLNEALDGVAHVDYRERRGVGAGPDLNFHLGRWGERSIKYYFLHDEDPHASLTNALPENR